MADLAELTDQALVDLAKAELPYRLDAYAELIRRYEPLIFHTSLRMIQSRPDAEELTQDAFLLVYHKIASFEGRSSFKTWLFRIVFNLCLRRRENNAKRAAREASAGEAHAADLTERQFSHQRTAELSAAMNEALDKLEEDQREIIVLKYVSGLQIHEIADVLGTKLSATKMRLYRSLEKLKEAYRSVIQDG